MNTKTSSHKQPHEWKSVTVRLNEDDLDALFYKLKLNGFKSLSQFIHAWIRGKYPA